MTKQDQKFELGISSWTFPWAAGAAAGPQPEKKMSPLELLKRAVELDVQVVQIADNMPMELLSKEQLHELKCFAIESKITIEVGTKGLDTNHLTKMIEIAMFLEAKILRTLPVLFGEKIGMAEVESNIKKILPQIENKEITIVLENTEAFLVEEYKTLMEKINHPQFRMCLDAANAIGRLEGPYYFLDTLVKYCANYHFKDIKSVRSSTLMGFSVEGTVSGQGEIPLKYALSRLMEHNIYTSVILEQWPPLLDNLSDTLTNEQKMAEESIEYLKSILN